MKITILNGNPEGENQGFEAYLTELVNSLNESGQQASLINLREKKLHYCVGCWNCWVKTPGECTAQDDGPSVLREVIASEFVLWASPLKMGFISALLKKMLDKTIPIIHPYFDIDFNEAHHRRRYDHYPRLGFLGCRETTQSEPARQNADLALTADLLARTAVNMKSRLEFAAYADQPVSQVAGWIMRGSGQKVAFANNLAGIPGASIQPPQQITFFNGSPRGQKGNTPILCGQFLEGFKGLPGRSSEQYDLVHTNEVETFREAFKKAECALIGFPLYTDAMPGIVKTFFEALEPLAGQPDNPPVMFLVQSGFPEAAHSRHVERYLAGLAERLGSTYLGCIVKGGAEGTRLMPPSMNAKLFGSLSQLGMGFSQTGQLDAAVLKRLASPEKYPVALIPLFKLFIKLPISNTYWDGMLKQNGAYEQRFARPYQPG